MKFDVKKFLTLNFPYLIIFYLVEKSAWLYRHCVGDSVVDKLYALFLNFNLAFAKPLPSFHPYDLLAGVIGAVAVKGFLYYRSKNAKKFRQGVEYGSARWGTAKDIAPLYGPGIREQYHSDADGAPDDEQQAEKSQVCEKQECIGHRWFRKR